VPGGLSMRYSFDEPSFRKQSAPSVPGMVGNALSFAGVRQFAELPSAAALNFGEKDFSIELWVRTTLTQGTRNFVDKRDGRPRGYAIFVERGSFGFQVAGGEQQISVAVDRARVSADGQWHHVAAVAKRLPPQAPALYIDGVLRANSGRLMPLESIDNDVPLWLGRHHRNGFVPRDEIYFTGAIDELAFYRRALSATEVKAIHAAGKAGKCR
jgi:Concanavalin A-like lectin/glucanases superfamily